jgi:hypothetical protein
LQRQMGIQAPLQTWSDWARDALVAFVCGIALVAFVCGIEFFSGG